jgi:flavin reductase (DIM6/NTAB) family NADH-FMN oxidoreductase RutF
LGLSVLSADQASVCRRLAGPSADRFSGLSWEVGIDGAVFLHGAAAWLDCSMHDLLPGGDHTIVLLRVARQAVNPAMGPLVFHAGELRSL